MLPDKLKELSELRLSAARECLETAKSNFENGFYKAAANRAYYSIFHAMRSVLALDEYDSKKHSGVISEFRKEYIKTNKFDVKFSLVITELFKSRSECDYDDFFEVSRDDVQRQISSAEEFLKATEEFLNK